MMIIYMRRARILSAQFAAIVAVALTSISTARADNYSNAVLGLNPDAYWRFNEAPDNGDPNADSFDETTHGHTLKSVSSVATQGIAGPSATDSLAGFAADNKSYEYTGPASGAHSDDNPYVPVTGTGPRSVIAWINTNKTVFEHTFGQGTIGILDYGTILSGPNTFTGFKFMVTREIDPATQLPTGNDVFSLNIQGRQVAGNTPIVPGQWYMLAVTFPGDASAAADFNANRIVDARDFLIWQRGFDPLSTTSTKATGDANGDNAVDGVDLAMWSSEFGSILPADAGTGKLGDAKLYVNGVLQTLTQDTGVTLQTGLPLDMPALGFRVGHDFGGWGMPGKIDEVSVWKSALSEQNILDLYSIAQTGSPVSVAGTSVPEPTSAAILSVALAAFAGCARRRF